MYARWMTTHGVKPNCAKITFQTNLLKNGKTSPGEIMNVS